MADDLDVDAMLEAAYTNGDAPSTSKERSSRHGSKEKDKKRDKKRDKEKDRDRRRERDKDREKDRDKDRDKNKDKDRDRKKDRHGSRERRRRRSKSRDRKRSRSRERKRSRDRRRSRDRDRPKLEDGPSRKERERRMRSPYTPPHKHRSRSPELTVEERNQRTVFCMQLAHRIRSEDLEEFFSAVGQVRDVRIIMDNRSRRSKGIAYIEFTNPDSVSLAIGLTGQRLLGVPIIVQVPQAEKYLATQAERSFGQSQIYPAESLVGIGGPMRLYVGSLHYNISEDMLRAIFEPFGKILDITINKDSATGQSKGFAFITFENHDDAKRAMDQLNGFELAGRPMKIGNVDRSGGGMEMGGLDNDEMDRAGIDLGATGRLQLMAKLAQGTGIEVPQPAAMALQQAAAGVPVATEAAPPYATPCFMLSNMFNPSTEASPTWAQEVREDVREECVKHGGVVHIYVDANSSEGNVYVKCPSISSAVAAVASLHGRAFSGRVIAANYVPVASYHSLFPDSINATLL